MFAELNLLKLKVWLTDRSLIAKIEAGWFQSYSRLVRLFWPDFRGESFWPNFKGGSFRPDCMGESFWPDLFIIEKYRL